MEEEGRNLSVPGDVEMQTDSPSDVPKLSSVSKTCFKCGSKFSDLSLFYKHRHVCQRSSISTFCYSCKRNFGFRSLLLSHRCVNAYRRKLRNRKQLQINLAAARGLIEKRPPAPAKKEESPPEEEEEEEEIPENDLPITCPKCKDKFSSPRYFQFHIVHNLCLPEISHCKICNREFDDVEEMKFHQVRCEEKQKMIDRVKERFNRVKKRSDSKKRRSFSCRACQKLFHTPQLLKAHLEKHARCIRIHNMKIKLRCIWERGGDLKESARKSLSNYKTGRPGLFSNHLKREDSPEKGSWESASSSSSEEYKAPIVGAARKTFRNTTQEAGSFCDVCYRYFSSPVTLRIHTAKHYESEKSVATNKCPECSQTFEDIYSLRGHQDAMDHWGKATKSMSTKFPCPLCIKEFTNAQSRNSHLKTHMDTNLDEVKEFVRQTTCSFCNQIFATGLLKFQHVKLCHSGQLSPDEEQHIVRQDSSPDKMFQTHKYVGYSNKNVLVNVTPTIEKQLKRFPNQCPICFRYYSTSFIRNRHFRTHTLDQAFECKFCPTKFPRSDRLLQHMQQEHNDYLAYECKQCGQRFTTRMRALQHGNKVHPRLLSKSLIKERNIYSNTFQKKNPKSPVSSNEAVIPEEEFYCDVCELSFLKLCGLQRHRQSKLHREILEKSKSEKALPTYKPDTEFINATVDQRPPLSTTPPFIDYSKRFRCSTCMQVFDSVNDFVPHRLSHFSLQNYGEKINELNPYSCEICSKVMDNHQKIQLHLFWHLQDVQLQAGTKKASGTVAGSPDHPASFSSHPVAKKSFHKSAAKNTPQELIIAGVKKPLFTCEACQISFTTKQHYDMHVERYCRMQKQNTEDKEPEKGSVTAGFCKICGCIFSSSSLYEEHKTLFCNKNTYAPLNENPAALYTEMVKSLMKLDTMVAGCVRCNLAFDSMATLSEHSSQHVLDANLDGASVSLENALLAEEKPLSICIESDGMQVDVAMDETSENMEDDEARKLETAPSTSSAESPLGTTVAASSIDPSLNEETAPDTITILRSDFSRLLCVLVSDPELMEQLGYGKAPIDEVLVNVLNQMGLVPVPPEEDCSTLERLRRNIRILLDVCIKDQIMELIAEGESSTDSIVAAALKMFGVEETAAAAE